MSTTFEYRWSEGYTIRSVRFPNGETKNVQYARDGLCLFVDGTSARYERIECESGYAAAFTPNEHMDDVVSSIADYLSRQ